MPPLWNGVGLIALGLTRVSKYNDVYQILDHPSGQEQEEEVAKAEETEKKAAEDEKKAAEKASRGILTTGWWLVLSHLMRRNGSAFSGLFQQCSSKTESWFRI